MRIKRGHRAQTIKDWFSDFEIKTLTWPANSPDLNPLENLWSWLDKKLSKVEPRTLEDLNAAINAILANVPESLIKIYIILCLLGSTIALRLMVV